MKLPRLVGGRKCDYLLVSCFILMAIIMIVTASRYGAVPPGTVALVLFVRFSLCPLGTYYVLFPPGLALCGCVMLCYVMLCYLRAYD